MAKAKASKTLLIIGGCLTVLSPLFAFSPLAMAYLATPPGGNMWSEGGNGGGSAIWLMFMTIPLGFLGLLAGIIVLIIGLVKLSQEKKKS